MSAAAEAWERAKDLAARFPIARDLRELQAEWDLEAARHPDPMPGERPDLANLVLGTGLLLLGWILGTFTAAMLP